MVPKKGQCFIAMELMEMSLDELIENQGKVGEVFPIHVVLDIITQIARGMCYLHGQNIAHRDLKPQNVVVTKVSVAHLEDSFCVKLVDFGMSKTKVQVSKSNTVSVPGVGTTIYRAPEVFPQAQQVPGGKKKVNWFLVDAYSFAMTCAQLLSLNEPFRGVPRSELHDKLQLHQRPELLQECPNDLVVLLKECWTTNPQKRPSFVDICSRLEKCKFQDLLKGSSTFEFEGLQWPLGFEYIERVLVKQSIVPSQCAITIPCDLDDTDVYFNAENIILEEASNARHFVEELHPSDIEYRRMEHKKKVGLWSRAKASFAQVSVDVMGAMLWGRRRNLHVFEKKFKELGVNPTIFPYNELRTATRHFKRILGYDLSGKFFKGELPNLSVVTVKRIFYMSTMSKAYVQDFFFREVFSLSKLKHKNIMNLKGCCIHGENLLLVYDYVDNFHIRLILFGSGRKMVSWQARLKIILGIAHGLHCVYVEANPRFIHAYISLDNVLVDKNGDPMITGFALALPFPDGECYIESDGYPSDRTGYMASKGYRAPEWLTTKRLDDKVDVYSFGILCMVIISAQRGVDITRPKDLWYLREWAWRLYEEDRLLELVDSTLNLTEEEVWDVEQVMKMSLRCIQEEPELRPSMAQVLSILQCDTEPEVQAPVG